MGAVRLRGLRLVLVSAFAALAPRAAAHEVYDSLVSIEAEPAGSLRGQWEIPLADLEDLWHEHATAPAERLALAEKHQDVIVNTVGDDLGAATGDGAACPLTYRWSGTATHKVQPYIVLALQGQCPRAIRAVQLIWTFMDAAEHKRRALVSFRSPGGEQALVLSRAQSVQRVGLMAPDAWAQFASYFEDGALHIWTGLDHLVFLLTLILPSVLYARGRSWLPREHFRETLLDVVRTVSAFTIAHSLTLALVTFHVLALPPRVVGAAIAVSVLVAALNNVVPLVDGGRWQLGFVFGLIHGVGFGGALMDLELPLPSLLLSLVGFNVGVEAGQLSIIAATVPLAFLLRRTLAYRYALLGGSAAAALVATLWLVERTLRLSFLPF